MCINAARVDVFRGEGRRGHFEAFNITKEEDDEDSSNESQ